MSNAEMKRAKERAERLEFVEDKIKELSTLIGKTTTMRDLFVKEKFQLENYPYKDGDKVVALIQTKGKKEEITGILEYDAEYSFNPRFYLRPFKKDGSISQNRRWIYDLDKTIVRFAEDPYKAHDEAEEETLFGSYFGQE